MSKSMKIILGVFGGTLLVMVLLAMLGILNLPIGPLNGMLAGGHDETVASSTTPTTPQAGSTAVELCDPVTGLPISGTGTAGGAGAAGAAGAGAAGAGAASGTGSADPLAGSGASGAAGDAAATPGATGATDPTTGAPVAAPAEGWDGSARVIAASDGAYDGSRVPDSWVNAADAVDPAASGTGGTAAGGAATATSDPVAGATDTGAAGAGTGAGAAGADASGAGAAAGAGAASGTSTAPVPCDQIANAGGATPGAGAAAGAAGAGAGAAAGPSRATTEGTSNGNNPEALRIAKDASAVMQKAGITVSTTAMLIPGSGGVGAPAAVKKYRATVSGASLVMRLDGSAMQQWNSAGKKVQTNLLRSFSTRLGKSFPKATRSITILDDQANVLAISDAAPGVKNARVKTF